MSQIDAMPDVGDISICNNCGCEIKDDCKRYHPEILASYDFEQIVKFFECFMKKGEGL